MSTSVTGSSLRQSSASAAVWVPWAVWSKQVISLPPISMLPSQA